jgi:phosphoserine phosphatase RsbU/P
MNILIAEDDAVSRRILEKVLNNWGHSVTCCEDGDSAWELFEKGEFRLVISDWMMPELDGLELCRKVRSVKRNDYCYFILLTAKATRENYMEGMDAGADDYLTKPLNTDELRIRLRVAERILRLHSDIQTLRSILPICAWCKKIRDDDTLWHSVEAYLSNHAEAEVSHSICPDCLQRQIEGVARLTSQ